MDSHHTSQEYDIFPDVRPEYMVDEYIISKGVSRDLPNPIKTTVWQPGQSLNLATLQMRKYGLRETLAKKQNDYVKNVQKMDEQWKTLEQKENDFRESFKSFNVFVNENAEKRERAYKKMQEDLQLYEQRSAEIERITSSLEEIKEIKAMMDAKIKKFRIFEEFLNRVVQTDLRFNSINQILDRYLSLVEAKNILIQQQKRNFAILENARKEMMKLIEQKTLVIMGLNNQIANLQERYENAHIKALESEYLVYQIKNQAVNQIQEIDEVKSALWNTYIHMASAKKHPIEAKKENVEEQLLYVNRVLSEMTKVNNIIKKKFASKK